jgi:hypothetical protein
LWGVVQVMSEHDADLEDVDDARLLARAKFYAAGCG